MYTNNASFEKAHQKVVLESNLVKISSNIPPEVNLESWRHNWTVAFHLAQWLNGNSGRSLKGSEWMGKVWERMGWKWKVRNIKEKRKINLPGKEFLRFYLVSSIMVSSDGITKFQKRRRKIFGCKNSQFSYFTAKNTIIRKHCYPVQLG